MLSSVLRACSTSTPASDLIHLATSSSPPSTTYNVFSSTCRHSCYTAVTSSRQLTCTELSVQPVLCKCVMKCKPKWHDFITFFDWIYCIFNEERKWSEIIWDSRIQLLYLVERFQWNYHKYSSYDWELWKRFTRSEVRSQRSGSDRLTYNNGVWRHHLLPMKSIVVHVHAQLRVLTHTTDQLLEYSLVLG